jgi:hypothetical protein
MPTAGAVVAPKPERDLLVAEGDAQSPVVSRLTGGTVPSSASDRTFWVSSRSLGATFPHQDHSAKACPAVWPTFVIHLAVGLIPCLMHIAKIPNRNARPSYLLRETYREDGKVKNRTLANRFCRKFPELTRGGSGDGSEFILPTNRIAAPDTGRLSSAAGLSGSCA